MYKHKESRYDVVIIGAGIGGLVCGCYLAKGGLRVLIVEKNTRPGGYCMSFIVKGFHFDACVHSLGSFRKGGILSTVLEELDLTRRIRVKRYDPSDIIITPDYKISFWNDLSRTIEEFCRSFPTEKVKIKEFFNYLNNDSEEHALLRKATFHDLLNGYFHDDKLKAILSVFVLGNAGLPASQISAFTAIKFYKEFMLDGGYYPKGGIQKLPDILAKRFQELGGDLCLSEWVETVYADGGIVNGVSTTGNGFIATKYLVSNVDTKQLFFKLIGKGEIEKSVVETIDNLVPSASMFILYLGLNKKIKSLKKFTNLWSMNSYDIDRMYNKAMNQGIDDFEWFLVRVLSSNKSILAMTNASFKTKEYWQNNKNRLKEIFIEKIENFLPGISNNITFKSAVTPHTLYGWTENYCGASYGWAETPTQFAIPALSQRTFIKNLYQTGHWTTLVQGVSGVVHLSRDTAKIILRKEKRKKDNDWK